MINKILNWLIILLPLALPLYVVRFNVGPLPTTLLEIYVLVLGVLWLLGKVNSGQGTVADKDPSPSPSSHIRSSLLRRPTSLKLRGSRGFGGHAWLEVRDSIGSWFWPLIVWLVVTLVAVFVAQDSWAAFGHWRAFMLEPVMVFVVLLDTLARKSPNPSHGDGYPPLTRGLLTSVAIVTILLGVYAVLQYVTGWGIPSPWDAEAGRRATGVFGYPNGLSLFIVPFGIVSWMRLVDAWLGDHMGSPLQLLMYGSASALALVATVLAKSMGGVLAFGIGVLLTLIIYKKTRIFGIVLTVFGVLGAGLVAWQIYGTELHPQTIEDNLASTKKWSSSVRVIIWQESWELVKENPLWGTGLRSYKTAILPYHQATWMEVFPHPHNIFLMLWIETGILGLLAFIWLLITWILVVLRTSYIVQKNDVKIIGIETKELDEVRGTKYENLVWLIPLVVILVHGMVDLPYFKNDLAIQFFLLAALATHYGTNYEPPTHKASEG